MRITTCFNHNDPWKGTESVGSVGMASPMFSVSITTTPGRVLKADRQRNDTPHPTRFNHNDPWKGTERVGLPDSANGIVMVFQSQRPVEGY